MKTVPMGLLAIIPGGLRSRVLLMLAVAALVSGSLAWLFAVRQLRANIVADLRSRSAIIGRAILSTDEILLALEEARHLVPLNARKPAQEALEQLIVADNDLTYLMIVDVDRKPIVWTANDNKDVSVDLGSAEGRQQIVAAHFAQDQATRELVRANQALHIVADEALGRKENEPLGTALIGLSPAAQLSRSSAVVRNSLLAAGVVVLIVLWVFFSRLFARLGKLRAYAEELAEGDLTQRLHDTRNDEIGALGRALESVTENLGETISRVRVASLELGEMSGQVRSATLQITEDASLQESSVRQTGRAMVTMSKTSTDVEQQIAEATRSAEASTEHLRDISRAIETVSTSVEQLAAAVDQAESHVSASMDSFSQTNHAVDGLNEAVDGTAAATTEITASIRLVDDNADKAFAMSAEASQKTQSGVIAVRETREGIEEIRSFANRSVESIRFLAEKVASIEQILDVISDIANQTRLVSLNASIIAAQAGEHGRGFMVVADEIKALAAKTAGSTRKIGHVIGEVLSVSGQVIDVVERGVTTVDEAIVRSDHANQVLSEILTTSTQTGNLVRSIASAVNEQARGARRVDRAMHDVHATAVKLRDIVAGQTRSTTDLEASMRRMRELMTQSLSTAREQARHIEQAIASMGSVFNQIHRIAAMNRDQAGTRFEVSRAFDVLENASTRHQQSARSLSAAVEQAAAESAALTNSVKVFRV